MVDSHKLGPQNYFHDAFNSYSSSEDGYSSSLDQHSTRSGDCSQENESLSDYTNITYV
uniref:Uncharacterized protein n=1 Tax=Arion vulgaris TaxID=1028688 RepID=A0A0B6ZDT0_9EUPU